ncbi:MAG TPA: Imm31 family immunity protein [Roseiflexaceae bacterium]|nr:Imm31 family immunity protein [Roseiflexaceae bacterium]
MNPRYQFYEVVRVGPTCPHTQLVGLEGVILGMSQEDSGAWGYAVMLRISGTCWDLRETDLEFTGVMESRASIYDGTKITVRIDPTSGDSTIAHSATPENDYHN